MPGAGDPRLLLLGGTEEARDLAQNIEAEGRWQLISSLAGSTSQPFALPGTLLVGGFGGARRMAVFVREQLVRAVIDATHPYAVRIARNAVRASFVTGTPAIKLVRRPWLAEAGDRWHEVDTVAQASAFASQLGRTWLVTLGQKGFGQLDPSGAGRCLVRSIEPIDRMPANGVRIEARPPFCVASELDLMRSYEVDVVITRNSGSAQVYAKIEAARLLGIPVVMIRRPAPPRLVPTVADLAQVHAWLDQVARGLRT
ncbi:MAG: cobalt-precorrin-6A reductase [Geminicoccaceae bacterium]